MVSNSTHSRHQSAEGAPACPVVHLYSREVDDGRDRLSRFYRVPLVVNPQLTDLALFRVGLHGAQVGPTAFGLISFGGATALHTPAQHNLYMFYGARASSIVLSQSGIADTYSTHGDGHIATTDSRVPIMARFDTGAELFAVSFDRAAVDTELEEELGHAVSPLHFPSSLETDIPSQRTYKGLLALITDEVASPTGLLDRPAVADRLGRALLTTMLHSAQHQYADELATPLPAGPHAVRIVTAALHADPAHPYTAVELARLAGVSLRSLQDAFHRHPLGLLPPLPLRHLLPPTPRSPALPTPAPLTARDVPPVRRPLRAGAWLMADTGAEVLVAPSPRVR
ncbi:hypothetical protein AB0I16_16410 [Streptomyces sp. NPDC050703]|uniref:hypothetical protein n=1 Tax=Streptomyces sp. NPDC050703 TaxID=3157218 RepID=UPI003437948F